MMTLSHPPNKPYSGLVKYSYFTIYSLSLHGSLLALNIYDTTKTKVLHEFAMNYQLKISKKKYMDVTHVTMERSNCNYGVYSESV